MLLLGKGDLIAKVTSELFDKPLVTNNFRSLLVEAMIDAALQPDWKWCSADYAAWDFERHDGLRLEVKQSAAKQSWAAGSNGYSIPRFDIAERKFRWEGDTRIVHRGRFADLYVFAFHPITDETADHRDPRQWRFYITKSVDLPSQKTISLAKIGRVAPPVNLENLRGRIEAMCPA